MTWATTTATGLLATAPNFGAVNYLVLIGYLAALVAMGVYFSRREKSTDDYFLAGRRIPWWAAGLSIFGTGLSAITYMAIPAKAYAGNWTMILTNFAPLLFIPVVVAVYIPFYRRLGVTTAYEYLERRFNVLARLLASTFYILFQFGRMAIVLYVPAVALATVTGMDVYWCIVVMGVLAGVYTVLGGIEAVIWTDVMQVVVLLGGAIICLCLVAADVEGGFGGVIASGRQAGKFETFNWSWDHTAAAVWVVVLGSLLSAIMPNSADQSVVQRYLTTPNERGAKRAAWTSALMGIPAAFLFFFLGTALWVYYQAHAGDVPADMKNIAILPLFVMQRMPVGVSGLVIAGIFAASMSSVDSSINGVATAFTTDFYRRFIRVGSERHYLTVARAASLVAGVIGTVAAVVIARLQVDSILDLFFAIMGLFGGSLAGMFILGLFTRRARAGGVLIAAALSAIVLYQVKANSTGPIVIPAIRLGPVALPELTLGYLELPWLKVHFLLFGGIGLGVCVAAGYVLSLLMGGKGKDITGLTIYTMPKANTNSTN